MNVYSLSRRSWLWGEGEETSSWISPKPPPVLQKLQSKIDSSEQTGNIRGAQERGTPGRGGLSKELERGPRLLLFPGVLCISKNENAKTEL